MSPLSKDKTGLGCSRLLAFLQLALCRPISLVWLGIGTLSICLAHVRYTSMAVVYMLCIFTCMHMINLLQPCMQAMATWHARARCPPVCIDAWIPGPHLPLSLPRRGWDARSRSTCQHLMPYIEQYVLCTLSVPIRTALRATETVLEIYVML